MLTARTILLLSIVALGVRCLGMGAATQKHLGTWDKPSYGDQFIPFADFLDQVQRAKFEDYEDAVCSEEEFEVMKAHILRMYEGVREPETVTSFVQDERYGDCVGIKEQPTYHHLGLGEIAEPPVQSRPAEKAKGAIPGCPSYADSPLKQRLKDRFGNVIACPEESIPMARLTLERLTRFRTLADLFSKVPGAAGGGDDGSVHPLGCNGWDCIHLHAHASQVVDNYGGNSWLDLWSPKGDFSISQHWYVGGQGCNLQTVEGGWQVDPSTYQTDQAVLFIYWTNHDYNLSGCTTDQLFGCYNLDCPAFQQVNHNWFLGGIWDHYSTTDGQQWGFELQWKLYQGNWWLWLKGPGDYEAVGYYPTSIFNGGQLSKLANSIDYGGEVARLLGDNWPQMGSGQLSEKGWEYAAYQSSIFYIPNGESGGVGVWADLTAADEALPACYTIGLENYPNGGSWGTNFYFGGPGGSTCQ
jgi:hypothetical protein